MTKKQYNYYMDEHIKEMLDLIRKSSADQIQGLSDSQIVEYLVRRKAAQYGYRDIRK